MLAISQGNAMLNSEWTAPFRALVPGLPPRPEMYQIDKRRVVGLTIDPTRLLTHRQQRQEHLGVSGGEIYVDPIRIYEELEETQKVMHRAGFKVIDVTDKPIENTAHEILTLVSRRLKGEPEVKPA